MKNADHLVTGLVYTFMAALLVCSVWLFSSIPPQVLGVLALLVLIVPGSWVLARLFPYEEEE